MSRDASVRGTHVRRRLEALHRLAEALAELRKLEGPKSTAATPPMTTSSGRPRPKRPIVATLRVPAPDRPAVMPAESCAGLAPRNAGAGALRPDMAADLGAADDAGDLAWVLTAWVGRTTREAVVEAMIPDLRRYGGICRIYSRCSRSCDVLRWLAKTMTERRLERPRSRAACCAARAALSRVTIVLNFPLALTWKAISANQSIGSCC